MLKRNIIFIALFLFSPVLYADLLTLTNYKSGINLVIEGTNGIDYAVERFYHDPIMDDHAVIYIKDTTRISLEHNERNVITSEDYLLWRADSGWTFLGPDGQARTGDERVIGINGADGIPDSGDEGRIFYKIDRDEQAHGYYDFTHPAVVEYTNPFSLSELFFEDSIPVVGTTGSNEAPYGTNSARTGERYHRGMLDQFGDEWHMITYWDYDHDFVHVYSATDHRDGMSDGKIQFVVVNPKTPLISFDVTEGEQYYTTPPKAYNVPVIHNQTSYLTGGALIQLYNITNSNPIYYRLDNGPIEEYTQSFQASLLGTGEHTIEYWFDDAVHKTRTLVVNPDFPSRGENHGYLLWKDDAGLAYIQEKFNRSPFSLQYTPLENRNALTFKTPLTERPYWRGWCGYAGRSFTYSVPMYIENKLEDVHAEYALTAKKILLDSFVVDPIGCHVGERHIPSGDRIDIPNSGMNHYMGAPLAYDLLMGRFKSTDHSDGVTPIEDYKIRDNMASQVQAMMFMRSHVRYSDTPNRMVGYIAGDMHWGLGYELLMYVFGIVMPSYSTPYYGTSGFDGSPAEYTWAPFKTQKLSWWDVVAVPNAPCASYPDNVSIRRIELCYKTYEELLNYPHHENTIWDFPSEGTFWIAANAFNGGEGVYLWGEKNPADLGDTEIMIIPDHLNPADVGLSAVQTATGRICHRAGVGRNRSFNLPTVTGENDGLWQTEYSGYEAPFVPNLILVNYLHKLHYGEPVSDTAEAYLDTKLDRMNGQFDPHYMQMRGASSDVLDSDRNPIPLNHEDFLLARVPLSIHNPLISSKGQVRLDTINEWIDTQYYYRVRSFGGSLLTMILFEDDPSRYAPMSEDDTTYPQAVSSDKPFIKIYNNIIKKKDSDPRALIYCNVPYSEHLKVTIYNTKGKKIVTLADTYITIPDTYELWWQGKDASGTYYGSGIYIVLMELGAFSQEKKIALIK